MPFDGKHTEQDLNLDLLCADILAAGERFDLCNFEHPCGTPACIAGHAVVLWPELGRCGALVKEAPLAEKIGVPEDGLAVLCWRFLKLGDHPAHNAIPSKVTAPMAVAALRRLRKTGEAYYDLADA